MTEDTHKTCFVYKLSTEQRLLLRSVMEQQNWLFSDADYCDFKAKKEKISVAMYTSGKLVVQGGNAQEFVEFTLEPLVLKEETFRNAEGKTNEPFSPHAGIDESGKGDFFGPLVVACVFVADEKKAGDLQKLGVKDSKLIKNDDQIIQIADGIRKIVEGKAGAVAIGPEAYNKLYTNFANLNKLLAWGHAKSLENMLQKAPECKRAIADQFGNEHYIKDALMEKGRTIELQQRTKAESDIAVAAASIIARAEFVRRLRLLEQEYGIQLPKGAGSGVDKAAKHIAETGGADALSKVAKMHFRTAYRALGLPEPERTYFFARR